MRHSLLLGMKKKISFDMCVPMLVLFQSTQHNRYCSILTFRQQYLIQIPVSL